MKKFIKSFFKKKVVLAAAVAMTTIGVAGAATVAQFSPDRPTKAYVQGMAGFDHVQFNSFTGVPNIGDERNFLTGKIATAPNGFYDPMNQVRDGNEILVRVYIHNNADSSLNKNDDVIKAKGIARNTRVRAEVPVTLAQAQQTKAFISADNAQPKVISDTLDINAAYPFEFDYVEGSARLDSNFVKDLPLSDDLIRGGVQIGSDKLDGNFKGCFEFVSVVTYKIKIKAPNYNVQKTVRLNGEDKTKWREEAVAKAGDTVEWKLEFKNTGATQLNGVDIFDQLPNKMTIVPGTTTLYNGNHASGLAITNDDVVKNGVDVGNYGANTNAIVIFKAKLPEVKDLACGKNTFLNKGFAKPVGQGVVTDNASVVVEKVCEQVNPSFSCDLLTAVKQNNRTVKYTTKTSVANGATVSQYVYNFGDGSAEVTSSSNEATHTYAKDGNYSTRVKVLVKVGNETKVVENDNCSANIDFTTSNPTYSCDLLKAEKTGDRNVKYNVTASVANGASIKRYIYNFGDGSAELTTDKSEATHTYAKDGDYSTRVKVQFAVGNETVTAEGANCVAPISFTNKPSDTPKTPVTPTALPNTGSGSVVLTFLAVASASTIGYYVLARRASRI